MDGGVVAVRQPNERCVASGLRAGRPLDALRKLANAPSQVHVGTTSISESQLTFGGMSNPRVNGRKGRWSRPAGLVVSNTEIERDV